MMNLKVCGLTTKKQLLQLEGINVDYAGFIFHKNSPRYAGDTLEGEDLTGMDLDIKKVGVFKNDTHEYILEMIDKYELDMVQLHGEEDPELCADLSEEVEVIKAFAIDENTKSIDALIAPYDAVCDYYLFDTKVGNTTGGTGKKFDWEKLKKSKIEKPFFLSGGIGPDDVALVKSFKHPDYFGVDVNSLFEKEPGVKDMGLVLGFSKSLQ
jgi:phosphoribosylanthranilate isomerase